jgi:VCBS repeat protein/immunoglobulin I-set domain protein
MKCTALACAFACACLLPINAVTAQKAPDFEFKPGSMLALDGNSFGYNGSADLDGDGVDEIVLAPGSYPARQSNALPILDWDGFAFTDIAPALISPVPTSDAFADVLTEDFDGDGRLDVFLGAFGYDDTPFPGSLDYLLFQKTPGQLTSAAGQVHRKANTTYYSTAGDINRDGRPDILVLTLETQKNNGPYFLVSNKAGTFKVKRKLLNPLYSKLKGDAPLTAAAIADFDNDGRGDIVVGREDGRYVAVYFNKKGSFKRDEPDKTLPKLAHGKGKSHPIAIEALDFDLDGFMDIVVFSAGWPDFAPFAIQFFKNIKGKKFKDVTASVLPGKPKVRGALAGLDRLRLVDFHGDGLVDLVGISEHGPDTTTVVFMNDGSGRFSEHGWQFFRATQGHNYRTVIAANLNGDNRTDLVTAYQTAGGSPQSTYQVDAFINNGVAAVTVPPTIVRNLKKRTKARKGEKLHLAALVRGDRPFTFEWMKNGQPIAGATGQALEYPKAKKNHYGSYSVQVTNAAGTVTSVATTVKVKKKKKKK